MRPPGARCAFGAATRGRAAADPRGARRPKALGYPSTLYSREDLPAILGSTLTLARSASEGPSASTPIEVASGCADDSSKRSADFERSPVTRILENGVETPAGSVRARAVIICADRFYQHSDWPGGRFIMCRRSSPSPSAQQPEIDRLFPRGPLMVWDTDLTYNISGSQAMSGCSSAEAPWRPRIPGASNTGLNKWCDG